MQRLKTRSQFQAALAGIRVATTAHFVLHRCALRSVAPESSFAISGSTSSARLFVLDDVWLGAMVPKRWAKRAVTRNTIKRQIYTVSSEFASALPMAAHVVRLRAGFDRIRFISASSPVLKQAVRGELQQLFLNATRSPDPRPQSGTAP